MKKQIGPYKIREKIGEGGMGKVYKAYHPELEREVAIKTVLSPDEKFRQRFTIEAKMMARLKHPNIVSIYDFGSEGEIDYIVMDLVVGNSLSHVIKKVLFPSRQSLQIMLQVVLAMEYAHQQGVIHRDLKPSNIMLEEKTQTPLIMDFGLAKDTSGESITKSGDVLGTFWYMPPEQISGFKTTSLVDIYALGVTLYEVLTGERPVDGSNLMEIMYNITYREPEPIYVHQPHLHRDLQIICNKAMAKEQSFRYQSAGEFAADIDRFLKREPISANPLSYWYYCRRAFYRWKYLVAIIVLFAISLVAIWGFHYRKRFSLAQEYIVRAKRHLNIAKPNLETYFKAKELLEKSYTLFPKNAATTKKLVSVYKAIGKMAIKEKDYLLGRIAVKHLQKLGQNQEAQILFDLLKTHQLQRKKREIQYLKKIMKKLKNKSISEGVFDWSVMQIIKMPGYHTIEKLLEYMKSAHQWQQYAAIDALGKLQDTKTKVKGKDSVQWLVAYLQELHKSKKLVLMEKVIWALGWLKDSRANKEVFRIRHQNSPGSTFWNKTKIPHQWLPIVKGKKILKKIFVKKMSKAQRNSYLQKLNDLGIMKMDKNDLLGAIVVYNRALELDPNSSEFFLNRGLAFQRLNRHRKAIADFNKSIKLNPLAIAYNNRGLSYQCLKNYTRAVKDYSKAIKKNPKFLAAYNNIGICKILSGAADEAIGYLKHVIAIDNKFIMAYLNLANAFFITGDFQNALVNANHALSLDDKFVEAYIIHSFVYKKQGKLSKAIADLTKAISLNPRSDRAYASRGMCWLQRKQIDRAIWDFMQALKVNPQSVGAYIGRAKAWVAKGIFAKAILDMEQAIKIKPKDHRLYLVHVLVLLEQGSIDKALKYCKQSLKIKNSPLGHSINGFLLALKKQWRKAIAEGKKGIVLYESTRKKTFLSTLSMDFIDEKASAYYFYGEILARKNNSKEALYYFNKALRFSPHHIKSLISKGLVLKKLRRLPRAIDCFTRVIDLNPYSAYAYMERGLCKYYLKKYSGAIGDYSQAINLGMKITAIYTNRAIAYMKNKQSSKAIADCNQVLAFDPKNAKVYSNRAVIFAGIGEMEKALADYSQAIALGFKTPVMHYQRGKIFLRKKSYKKAIKSLTVAINMNQNNFRAYAFRGVAQEKSGNLKEALEDYDRALGKTKSAPAYFSRARLFEQMGEDKKTMDDYNKAIELQPKSNYYNGRGFLWAKMEEYTKAITDYSKAISLQRKYVYAFTNRALARAKMRDLTGALANGYKAILKYPQTKKYFFSKKKTNHRKLKQALKDCKRALKLNPKHDWAYNNLGVVYILRQNLKLALFNFNKAIKVNNKFDLAYNNRAVAYILAKNPKAAFQDFDTASRLNPKLLEIYYNKGFLCLEKNKRHQAKIHFRKITQLQPDSGLVKDIKEYIRD